MILNGFGWTCLSCRLGLGPFHLSVILLATVGYQKNAGPCSSQCGRWEHKCGSSTTPAYFRSLLMPCLLTSHWPNQVQGQKVYCTHCKRYGCITLRKWNKNWDEKFNLLQMDSLPPVLFPTDLSIILLPEESIQNGNLIL